MELDECVALCVGFMNTFVLILADTAFVYNDFEYNAIQGSLWRGVGKQRDGQTPTIDGRKGLTSFAHIFGMRINDLENAGNFTESDAARNWRPRHLAYTLDKIGIMGILSRADTLPKRPGCPKKLQIWADERGKTAEAASSVSILPAWAELSPSHATTRRRTPT